MGRSNFPDEEASQRITLVVRCCRYELRWQATRDIFLDVEAIRREEERAKIIQNQRSPQENSIMSIKFVRGASIAHLID